MLKIFKINEFNETQIDISIKNFRELTNEIKKYEKKYKNIKNTFRSVYTIG